MIAYSIEHAQKAGINRIVVSTDSPKYASIANQYGAETPFLRPAELSKDLSHDIETFIHTLSYLKEQEGYEPDLVVHLRPTCPIRNPCDIKKMIEIMKRNPNVDCIRSILPTKENPYKMYTLDDNSFITPVSNTIPEAYSLPRQMLPMTYIHDSSIDVLRSHIIMQGSMHGRNITGYIPTIKEFFDIDDIDDFNKAELYLRLVKGDCTICFDIDGVIASLSNDNDYKKSKPNSNIIRILNILYDYGNTIILNTARGYITGLDWTETTKKHLAEWGVKYHKLLFGKPAADVYFDDRMASLSYLNLFVEK